MNALETVDRLSLTADDVDVACLDVRRDDGKLVLELEVRLPVQESKPVVHHIPGFHADVTGC